MKAGNYFASDVTTPISNPNSLYVHDLDASFTPDIAPTLLASAATTIRSLSGSAHALRLMPGGGSRGVRLDDAAGTQVGQWINTGSGTGSVFQGISSDLSVLHLLALVFGSASTTSPSIRVGSGTPEGVVTGVIGCLFLRTDGGATTTLYVKTSGTGNTGWTAK
jgi:hypothetical protein